MNTLLPLLTFVLGALLGATAIWFIMRNRALSQLALSEKLNEQMKTTFDALAANALQANSQHLLNLAQSTLSQHTTSASQQLDTKQQVITTTLTELKGQLTSQLTTVSEKLAQLEKERHSQYSALGQQLQLTQDNLTQLRTTTSDLKNALTNARVRGQWGERMADDVLRLAGLQENIQFRKQQTLNSDEGNRSRPDLTFLLPGNRVIHMDVKFPLDHYLAYLEATTDDARSSAQKAFSRAARLRIKEAASRDYRSASTRQGEEALDYVLTFIPNEQVYAFLLETDPDILGEAIRQHVILCSPTTLLAVLAVIRQALENFALEQRTAEIQTLIAQFQGQWQKFIDEHDKIGEAIHRLQGQFNTVLTTRKNMLERPMNKLTLNVPTAPDSPANAPLLTALSSNSPAN